MLCELIKHTHFLTSVCNMLKKDRSHRRDWSLGFSEMQYFSQVRSSNSIQSCSGRFLSMPFETLQCSGPGSGLQKLIERQGQLSESQLHPAVFKSQLASWCSPLQIQQLGYGGWENNKCMA